MAKTFTAMLVGIAHQKGFVRSLDDKAADYWPEIAASAYGQTSIRNLLHMGSGVPFKELYTWTPDDDIWVWGQLLYAEKNRKRPEVIVEYLNTKTSRETDQGTRFRYATIETEILGRMLIRATGRSISQLTEDWLWTPMGAESEARWLVAPTDWAEATGGGFNTTLRDYARFGVLLANDGKREILVQPSTKIVMVQTAVFDGASGRQDSASWGRIWELWRDVLSSLGGNTESF